MVYERGFWRHIQNSAHFTCCATPTAGRERSLKTFILRRLSSKAAAPGILQQSTSQCEPPETTSTAAAQPLGVPSSGMSPPIFESPKGCSFSITSSIPAGTPLKGINYFKNKEDPIAMDDSGYPSWLWTLLSERKGQAEGQKDEVDPRLYSKSARARQLANKRARKMNRMNPDARILRIPLHQQTLDLPFSCEVEVGAATAVNARHALTRAMRMKRRHDINETNFLKEMG